MAITDSLSSLSLPPRCCSTTNRRNRAMRSFREKPGLASTRSSCRRAAYTSDSATGIVLRGYLLFSALCKRMKPSSNLFGLVLAAWQAHRVLMRIRPLLVWVLSCLLLGTAALGQVAPQQYVS